MIDWWNSIRFSEHWVLLGLVLVPIIAVVMYLLGGRGKPVLTLSSFRYLKGIPVPAKVKWRPLLYLFRVIAVIFLIAALARPQSRGKNIHAHGEGIDIILSIDVSPSMEGTDFFPTRLEAAKLEAARFVDARPDDRIGVVIFSGETFTLCPLTSDHAALNTLITNIHSGELEMGTAIGMGLAKAVERLKESKAKSKVVVLMTDGENNGGMISPEDAGRLAKTFGVRVYTVGLGGTQGKVLTPTMQNPDGSYVMQYQDVDIDEGTLMKIAATTGGKYFRASDGRKLEQIYEEINKLEKSEFEKNRGTEDRHEEFLPFLLLALFFIALEYTLRYTTFDSLT